MALPLAIDQQLYVWHHRAKREALRWHGDRWSAIHDRTVAKLLYRWQIISKVELQDELQQIDQNVTKRCLATPGLGKYRYS